MIKTPLHAALYSAGNMLYIQAAKAMRGEDAPARYVPSDAPAILNSQGGWTAGTYGRTARGSFEVAQVRVVGIHGYVIDGMPPQGLNPEPPPVKGR